MATNSYNFVDARFVPSIFNILGVENAEFLAEVSDSSSIKKNEVYFALFVNGLPGEPDFDVGINTMVGELNVGSLRRFIENQIEKTLPDLVDGITLDDYVIQQVPDQQFVGVDLVFTDLDTDNEVLIPVGFRMN